MLRFDSDPLGELTAPPNPQLDLRGRGKGKKQTGGKGEQMREGHGKNGRGRGRQGKEKEKRGISPPRSFLKVGTYAVDQCMWKLCCMYVLLYWQEDQQHLLIQQVLTAHRHACSLHLQLLKLQQCQLRKREHSKKCAINASYISPDTQNNIIGCINTVLQQHIVEEVVQAKMFSLLADETADSSHTEQLRQSVFGM